jgi:hypothetical protein
LYALVSLKAGGKGKKYTREKEYCKIKNALYTGYCAYTTKYKQEHVLN